MVGCDGVVQNIYLEAPGGLPEQVKINIPVTGELQQEFPPVASVGYMIAGMIKKSPSSSRHWHPQFFDYRSKCMLKKENQAKIMHLRYIFLM
jgi:hypothetical protein